MKQLGTLKEYIAVMGVTVASFVFPGVVHADEQWLGLTWRNVTKSQLMLSAAAAGIDEVELVEVAKERIFSEPHRRGYRIIHKVQTANDNENLLCIEFGESRNYSQFFVINVVTKSVWTSNFCRD